MKDPGLLLLAAPAFVGAAVAFVSAVHPTWRLHYRRSEQELPRTTLAFAGLAMLSGGLLCLFEAMGWPGGGVFLLMALGCFPGVFVTAAMGWDTSRR